MADGMSPMESEPRRSGGLRPLRWGAGAATLGLLMIYQSVDQRMAPVPPPAAVAGAAGQRVAGKAPAATTPGAAAPVRAAPSMPRSKPTRISIPQIVIEAPFTELGLDATGALEAPRADDPNLVGWYRGGPTPGERGSAVVAGHVDTAKGPAVFLMLHRLLPGNTVEIIRADGTVAVFAVDSVQSFPKNGFPDAQVYADTPDAQLRLITCGGSYDRKLKDYTDNVVVFAHLQSSRKA